MEKYISIPKRFLNIINNWDFKNNGIITKDKIWKIAQHHLSRRHVDDNYKINKILIKEKNKNN